jgi:hypothetical protein
MDATSTVLRRSEFRNPVSGRTCQMKRFTIATAMSLCLVSLATISSADTLIMRDGTRVEGTVTGIAGRTITFRHADGVSRRYPTSEVEALEFVSADRANPRAVSARRLEAPAGTQLVVRTVERIDSRNGGAAQTFGHCRRGGHERVGGRDYSQRDPAHNWSFARCRPAARPAALR